MTTNNRQSVDEALLQTVRCIKAFVAESDGIKPETIALIKMGGGMVIDPKPRSLIEWRICMSFNPTESLCIATKIT